MHAKLLEEVRGATPRAALSSQPPPEKASGEQLSFGSDFCAHQPVQSRHGPVDTPSRLMLIANTPPLFKSWKAFWHYPEMTIPFNASTCAQDTQGHWSNI